MKKLAASIAVLACVITANSYDFQDADYNQYLASQFDGLEDSSALHPRARRDDTTATTADKDKCQKKHHFKVCCAEEPLKKLHNEDRALKKECVKQVTSKEKHELLRTDPFKCDPERIERVKKEINCVVQCIAEKKQCIDEKGVLIAEKIKTHVRKTFETEAYFADKIDGYLDTCIAEGLRAPAKVGELCSAQALTFAHCMWREVQNNCPADEIKDQKACERVRARIRSHPENPISYHKHFDDELSANTNATD